MKSLDKNKTKELESWQIDKGAQEAENKVAKNFYDKAMKTKELDWENKYLFYQEVAHLINKIRTKWDGTFKVNKYFKKIEKLFEKEVNKLLTQQRSELLEEILNLECLKEEKITAELEDEACKMEQESEGSVSAFEFIENEQKEMETRNQLRKEIIEEINKL